MCIHISKVFLNQTFWEQSDLPPGKKIKRTSETSNFVCHLCVYVPQGMYMGMYMYMYMYVPTYVQCMYAVEGWRRGSVVIASTSGTEVQGLNPAMV
jgi:hypothetical protein